MDELDRRILQEADGGTIRSTQLARRLGEPLSTVHFRLRRLEESKVIVRYKGEDVPDTTLDDVEAYFRRDRRMGWKRLERLARRKGKVK